MADVSQGPGWWLASDGKWYPPGGETAAGGAGAASGPPGRREPQTQATPAMPAQPQPPPAPWETPGQADAPGPPGSSLPPAPLIGSWGMGGAPNYPQTPGAALPQSSKTNRFAIASLVCSLAGIVPIFLGLPLVLGVVFGFVGLNQIKKSGGAQGGRGLAMAGIIIGGVLLFLAAIALIAHGHGHRFGPRRWHLL